MPPMRNEVLATAFPNIKTQFAKSADDEPRWRNLLKVLDARRAPASDPFPLVNLSLDPPTVWLS